MLLLKMSIRSVITAAVIVKTVSVVPIVLFTFSYSFSPMKLPITIVEPRVRPVIRLVTICVTCVPVDTAATLSALQNLPTTNRSTAPYND